MKKSEKQSKFKKVMKEFGEGKLHSGSKMGALVTKPSQAKAIAYSESKRAKAKKKQQIQLVIGYKGCIEFINMSINL